MTFHENARFTKYYPRFNSTPDYSKPTPLFTNQADGGRWVQIGAGQIVFSRTTIIAVTTVWATITCASLVTLAALLHREWIRRRQTRAAEAWGLPSRFDKRISTTRKEIDDQYSRQYGGCLYQEPENPFMRCNSPVELMEPERLYEAPAIPPQTIKKGQGRNKRLTLYFSEGVGLWIPRR